MDNKIKNNTSEKFNSLYATWEREGVTVVNFGYYKNSDIVSGEVTIKWRNGYWEVDMQVYDHPTGFILSNILAQLTLLKIFTPSAVIGELENRGFLNSRETQNDKKKEIEKIISDTVFINKLERDKIADSIIELFKTE